MFRRSIAEYHAIGVGVILCACLAWPTAALATARPDSGTVAATRHAKDVTLRIVVRALPHSLSAKIVLTGPHHLRKLVARSVSLELPLGVWTLAAAPVRAKAGAYYATVPRVRERLVVGKPMTATVSYATLVPKTTKVVPASDTVSLAGEPSGPRTLTLDGTAAREAKVGEYLASGVTPAAPDGYLVKVVSLAHSGGGRAVAAVDNATLLEALPSGEIAAEEALEPPAEAEASSVSRHGVLTPARGGGREPTAHTADFILHTTNLTCETGAGVHVESPSVTFSPSMAIHAHWGFFKLDSASFTATVAASLEMGAEADAGAHCETNDPGIGLFPHEISLPDIDVQVGPVPVVITPKLQVYLSGSASITAKVSFSIEQSASATVGVSYEHGRFSPIDSFPEHFKQSFTPEGDASAEVALTPTVDTLIYGVAGPSFDIGAAAKFNADIHKTPWWTLQGCLQAGIGFVISPLDLNWSDPHLIQLCKTLLTASTAPPGSGGGGPGASAPPVNSSPPVIKDLSEPPKIGEVLYAAPGNWLGTVTYYNYQWQRCSNPGDCTPITGASGAYYQTTPSDVRDTIRVAVSAGNSAGASTPAVSAETEEVIEGQCKPASATAEGTVYGWGYNERYELGDGNTANSSLPIESCISGVREVAAASDDIYALGTNGLVYGWGPSCSGSILATSTDGLSPGVVLGLSNIKQIATESASTGYALSNDGKVYSWGTNELGQLGDGMTTSRWVPEQVQGLPPISHIYAGDGTAFAVAEDGAVYMWGNVPVALASEHETQPTLIPGLAEVKRIASGGGAFFFLHDDGTVEAWGNNIFGLLGIGSPNPLFASTRQPIPGLSNVVSLAAGSSDAFAVESNGNVYSWGFDGDDLGRPPTETATYIPERIPGVPPMTDVVAGGYGTYVLSKDGTVYAWGGNESGQLGDGTTEASASPVKVQRLSDVTAITASINDGIAIVGSAE